VFPHRVVCQWCISRSEKPDHGSITQVMNLFVMEIRALVSYTNGDGCLKQ